MSTIYFVFGLCQAVTGYAAWVFRKQETFRFDAADYPNIGTDGKRLVVYFSRMGYVKKQAYLEAQRTGAEVYEIRATEPTAGTGGFWWCGRFGLRGIPMPIEPIAVDLTRYGHVTICTPVWVFSVCAPVRSFCMAAAGKIREADYISVHFNKSAYPRIADTLDGLLGIRAAGYRSICSRMGEVKAQTDVTR